MKKDINYTNHTLIINELEKSIKFYNWEFILSFLPPGSFLVGGYIRDIILGRISSEVDVDIVVPSNSIDIGQLISKKFNGKLIILDKKRQVVRIIFNHISIDIAKQTTSTITGDLKSRDFSINSIAFSLDRKVLIDPLNGIKDIQIALLRTYSEKNLIDDPLRIIRCFRFVSELNFSVDAQLLNFIKKFKILINDVAKERINYEIHRIVCGENALESIRLINANNIFYLKEPLTSSSSMNLKKINYKILTQKEKEHFLPLFYLVQILDQENLEDLRFSKSEIMNAKLLRKWSTKLTKKEIFKFDEEERFNLHRDLKDILPSFIFFLPQKLHLDWLNKWRDKNDKLFHPANLISGDVIKKHFDGIDGPVLGKLLYYLSKELAYHRLDNFDEAIYKAQQWIEQNAPKCD